VHLAAIPKGAEKGKIVNEKIQKGYQITNNFMLSSSLLNN
jgi:hypothetical protein